jgi:hypothetical protein
MRVQTPDTAELRTAVIAAGGGCAEEGAASHGVDWSVDAGGAESRGDGGVDGFTGFVDVHGLSAVDLAELFLQARIRVVGLAPVRTSLQDVYAGLTADLGRHRSSGGEPPDPSGSQEYQYAARMTEGVAGQ